MFGIAPGVMAVADVAGICCGDRCAPLVARILDAALLSVGDPNCFPCDESLWLKPDASPEMD